MVVDQNGPTESEYVTRRIVRQVATVTDTAPTELPPLGRLLDVDALVELFPRNGRGNCCVSFRYAGAEVEVNEAGEIEVSPVNDSQ